MKIKVRKTIKNLVRSTESYTVLYKPGGSVTVLPSQGRRCPRPRRRRSPEKERACGEESREGPIEDRIS